MWHALSTNRDTSPLFDGVFAVDTLQTRTTRPRLIVCNTDPSDRPGRHWLLFFWDGDVVEMFDSLGRDVDAYDPRITTFLRHHASGIRRTERRIQPPDTALCGHYCLYYAYLRCRGDMMPSIVEGVPSPSFVSSYVATVYDLRPSVGYQKCLAC